MKVYIVLENGYEDGESVIMGVYKYSDDAIDAARDLRRKVDPLDDWLFYSVKEAEVREVY